MGMIRVQTWGSFGQVDKTFKAQTSGHAVAADDALQFLQGVANAAAVKDQKLRTEGHEPDDGFAEAEKRGLLGG